MYRNRTISGLLACSALGALGCSTTVHAVSGGQLEVPDGITAIGRGEVSAEPELARLTVGVEATHGTAAGAMAQAAQGSNAMLKVLRDLGVAQDDIKTAGFTLQPERPDWRPPEPPMPMPQPPPAAPAEAEAGAAPQAEPAPPPALAPKPRDLRQPGYRAVSAYEVTLRDLTRIGEILEALTRAGANRLIGIACDVKDREALARTARDQAVADARARAEQIAQAARVQLGAVTGVADSLSEGFPPPPPLAAAPMEAYAAAGGGGPVVPIQCDRVRMNYVVTVHFDLD